MTDQKFNFDDLENEIEQLRQQLAEREAIKSQFGELYRQRQAIVELRDLLAGLTLPDTIDGHDALEDGIAAARDGVVAAMRVIAPNESGRGTRQRRASNDPGILRAKEDFAFRRQAKIMAGLVDAKGRPKKRLNEEEQVKFEESLKDLKRSGWYPPELVQARQMKQGRRGRLAI